MFIAMNNFRVVPGREQDFENGWRNRETYLNRVPGIVQFALLKGDEPGEYISHTVWTDRSAFDAWTKSDAFTMGHRGGGGGSMMGILQGHPQAKMYEAVLVEELAANATA